MLCSAAENGPQSCAEMFLGAGRGAQTGGGAQSSQTAAVCTSGRKHWVFFSTKQAQLPDLSRLRWSQRKEGLTACAHYVLTNSERALGVQTERGH